MNTTENKQLTHEEIVRVGRKRLRATGLALLFMTPPLIFLIVLCCVDPTQWGGVLLTALFCGLEIYMITRGVIALLSLRRGGYRVVMDALVKKTSHGGKGGPQYIFMFSRHGEYGLLWRERDWYAGAEMGDRYYLVLPRVGKMAPFAVFPTSEYVWEESEQQSGGHNEEKLG